MNIVFLKHKRKGFPKIQVCWSKKVYTYFNIIFILYIVVENFNIEFSLFKQERLVKIKFFDLLKFISNWKLEILIKLLWIFMRFLGIN